MKVEVIEKTSERNTKESTAFADAAVSRAMQDFTAVIDSDDSLFCMERSLAGPSAEGFAEAAACAGEVFLRFRSPEHSREHSLHFKLLEKVTELLKGAGSQEFLTATLCLTKPSRSDSNEEGLGLWLRLRATGDSLEQAGLRWSLGLAHMQQALLFTSRHLRQQLTQSRS